MRAPTVLTCTALALLATIALSSRADAGNPEQAGGKENPASLEQLEQRVAQLERRLAAIEGRVAQGGAEDSGREREATQLYQEVQRLTSAGEFEKAKTSLAKLNSDYSGTNAQRQAGRLNQELGVIGKPAPSQYDIVKWYQGENSIDLAKADRPTLLIFWEVWCPHCRREVPKLQQMYTQFKDKGLQVVAVTKITKSATEQKVLDFVQEQNVTYPVAKESGELSRYFNVSGIPAAAVVKGGKVIWRGHPATLNDAMIEKWLGG